MLIKSKKAQAGGLLFAALIAFMLFFSGMLIVNFVKTSVTSSRNDINCSVPATDGTKALCLLFDGVIPYLFVIVISAAGGLITSRFVI